MTDKIKFMDKEYTETGLNDMTVEQLLETRNLVASNLNVAAVRAFKDHETAVAQTWKALVKFQETVDAENAGTAPAAEKPAKAPKAPKEPKGPRPLAKPAQAQYVKRPNRKHFATVEIIKQHTGAEGRGDRWPNYKNGMMIIDAIEGEGTLAWDIMNWAEQGLMKINEPTDAEYTERRAAWYKKHGMEDPDLAKERKAAEREKAKEERAAKAAADKAEKEAAKAAKAAEKAKADAEAATQAAE